MQRTRSVDSTVRATARCGGRPGRSTWVAASVWTDRVLAALVREKVGDGQVLEPTKRLLEQDVMEGMTRWTPTPKGSAISPWMSNLFGGTDGRSGPPIRPFCG